MYKRQGFEAIFFTRPADRAGRESTTLNGIAGCLYVKRSMKQTSHCSTGALNPSPLSLHTGLGLEITKESDLHHFRDLLVGSPEERPFRR